MFANFRVTYPLSVLGNLRLVRPVSRHRTSEAADELHWAKLCRAVSPTAVAAVTAARAYFQPVSAFFTLAPIKQFAKKVKAMKNNSQ